MEPIADIIARVVGVFDCAEVVDTLDGQEIPWRTALNAAHKEGYKLSVGPRGRLVFSPLAYKWQKPYYDLALKHEREIVNSLRKKRATK